MTYKNISLILFFFGLLCIVYSIAKDSTNCPSNKIQYKYIEKENDINNPIQLNKIYKKMFDDSSPWFEF